MAQHGTLRRSASCDNVTGDYMGAILGSSLVSPRDDEAKRRRYTFHTDVTSTDEKPKALSRSDLRQVELLGRSLSNSQLDYSTPLEGQVLVLARCRDRQSHALNLSWRSAFFAVSHGGVLRIFRSAEDRQKWVELGTNGENLAKWRSAISDAHVVSCLRELPAAEASVCRRVRKRAYCGATRARCAALGPTPIEGDEDDDVVSVDTASPVSSPPQPLRRLELFEAGCSVPSKQPYYTFDVWLRNDIANPNAKPVLKFAGRDHVSDIRALHHSLLTCSQHFQGPKQTAQKFSHPLLANYPNALSVPLISS